MKQTSRSAAKRPHRRHREAGTGAARKAAPVSKHRKRGPALRHPGVRENFRRNNTPQTGTGTDAARKAASEQPDWIDWLDGLDDCCHAIETLAGLLLACGDDVLDGELARGAGFLINEQIRQLKALRKQLRGRP